MTDALRKAIEDSGLTLYRIAKDTGIEQASLLRFNSGRQSLRLDLADKLAAYFGLTVTKQKGK
jgi:transcriptional regulator with XRE-family HTH domain